MKKRIAIIALTALALAYSPAAAAQDPPRQEAIVLALDHGEILTDLGLKDGLTQGREGQLLNRVELSHPITGVSVVDLVPLAPVTVLHVGEVVSRAAIDKSMLARVKPGDVVRFADLVPPPKYVLKCPRCEVCVRDDDARAVHAVWTETVGKSTTERVRIWRTFLEDSPSNRYQLAVKEEIRRLHSIDESLREAARLRVEETRRQEAEERERAQTTIMYHQPLHQVNVGTAVRPVAFVLSDVPIEVVQIHVRKVGESFFNFTTMEPFGDAHYRVTLPADLVAPPGLEYYIVAQDRDGRRIPVFADAKTPHRLAVLKPLPAVQQLADRSSASFHVEWADFFLKSAGTDFFWKAEGDFAYRLRFGPFYSFRMGFGIFEGVGGPAAEVEAAATTMENDDPAEQLTLSYSYFEPEFELGEYVHIIPRLVIGAIREKVVADSDNLHRGESILGFHTYLRIGKEQGTNLLLGGSLTQEMGLEALVSMNLAVFEHFPIGVSVAATNLPVAEDYAARLALQVGWRQFDWMSVDALLGVNMRNIRHVGMGGGLGLSFNW